LDTYLKGEWKVFLTSKGFRKNPKESFFGNPNAKKEVPGIKPLGTIKRPERMVGTPWNPQVKEPVKPTLGLEPL